ncbi:MAG: ATP-binding protein [Povalibacter sp.]
MTGTPEAGDTRIGSRWRVALQRYGSSLAVLLVGLAVTWIAGYLQYRARTSEAREQFSAWSEDRQRRLTRAIDSHIEVLYGLRALFDSSEYVSPEEFDRYAQDAVQRHRHLRSVGFLRHITDAERAEFEAYYSQLFGIHFSIVDPGPNGTFVPAPKRAYYVPLVYTQRRDTLPQGIDALANPLMPPVIEALRREPSARAVIAEGSPTDGMQRRFVHIYLPVYQHHVSKEPAAQQEPYGYVRLRMVLDDIIADTADEALAAGIEQTLIVPPSNTPLATEGTVRQTSALDSQLMWRGSIVLADRNLILQLRATRDYKDHAHLVSIWPLLIAGLTLTLLGTATAYFLARSRLRLAQLADSLLVEVRERKLSEQRTAQSETRYGVLIENSPDGILLYRQLRVVFANRAAVELFRAGSVQDLLGRDILELVHPEFHERVRQRIERMRLDNLPLPPIEQRLYRLDGSSVDVEVRTVPFMSDGEQLLQIAVRDITERRRAERERAGLETALRQSQRLESIGTLTGGIAHDFNNILSSIVGNIQLVLADLPSSHPARQSAHEIRKATNRARDLVKRLMTFSREQEAPQTPIEVAPLVEEVQQLLRPALPAGVVLQTTIPDDTPPVIADATQLHQVLVNLCTNAWQAMSSGQGRIELIVSTVSAEEARAKSKATLEGAQRYVCFEVRDDGEGIPVEIVDRIFEPFFTTKGAGEGSGLGLAVVHGIVHSHKGAITTSSRVGVGTTFQVYLPASEVPVQPAIEIVQTPAKGENQHVLYVDDEEPLVFLVTRVLERSGYLCTGTMDAKEAIELVRRQPDRFDLVLSDMNMPGMSGLDVAREILTVRPDLPVVITTGYIRATDLAAARALGVRDLILKPDTIEELPLIVNRYLDRSTRVA